MSFFFNDTATTEIYTLSLHDALPISIQLTTDVALSEFNQERARTCRSTVVALRTALEIENAAPGWTRPLLDRKSNTSELQSRQYLVCRLLLEKKNIIRELHVDDWNAY